MTVQNKLLHSHVNTCGNWTRGLGTDGGRQADDDATGDTEDPATEGLVGAC